MRHLLIWANKQKDYDLSNALSNAFVNKELLRIKNSLVDLGTRHRQIGKTTAILELAKEFNELLPDAYVVVIHSTMRSSHRYTSTSRIIHTCNTDFLSFPSDDVKIVLLADEASFSQLKSLWSDPRVIFKAGWMPEEDKVY